MQGAAFLTGYRWICFIVKLLNLMLPVKLMLYRSWKRLAGSALHYWLFLLHTILPYL